MPDTTIKFRMDTRDEMTEFEQSEWKFAKETVDWYFIPKLMEYDHFRDWYIPNILNWHTPHVMNGGIELQASVPECLLHSNEDAGWVSVPSDFIEFVLGKDSFVGMVERYSTASVNRDSDKIHHIHINPTTKSVLVDIVSNPQDEQMREWMLKNDMHGVVYRRKINRDTFGPQVVLKRFQKEDYIVDLDEEINNVTDIEDPAVLAEIKSKLGL